ncbi:MAG: cell division protein FtsW [Desulfonauticus sp.]|nr:MAG: Cell division protein FtsW [Desulfonauticus sp. 38_4375]MDK2922184.1 cell division protein FtsW [Desulfonauticus sp.]
MVKKYKNYFLYDNILLFSVLILCVIGLTMIFSSSSVLSESKFSYLTRQAVFMAVGVLVMLVTYKININLFFKMRYIFIFVSILLLSLVLFSPWSKSAGGARRWLYFHYFSVQPLEFVKFTLLIYLSYFYGFKQDKIDKFSVGILPPLVLTLAFCTFLFLQPDFGGAVFLLSVFLGLAFVGGVPLRYFGGLLGLGIGGVVLAVLQAPYRLERIKAFLNPFQDPYDSGYQLIQSFYGLVNGGIWGVGLGESKQKFFYLPEAHNDFILSILGEELGFWGLSLIFVLILLIFWRWIVIFLRQQDLERRLLAFGAGFILLWNMYLNLGVVLGVVPPKGIPMPFISYGGSNLLLSFTLVGLLLNLSKRGQS